MVVVVGMVLGLVWVVGGFFLLFLEGFLGFLGVLGVLGFLGVGL